MWKKENPQAMLGQAKLKSVKIKNWHQEILIIKTQWHHA